LEYWFVTRRKRLSPDARFVEVIDAWLFALGATKPAARTLAAYRADVEGVAKRRSARPRGRLIRSRQWAQPLSTLGTIGRATARLAKVAQLTEFMAFMSADPSQA
jgi:hypothetical protein